MLSTVTIVPSEMAIAHDWELYRIEWKTENVCIHRCLAISLWPALTRPNCVIDWIEPNLNRVFEHAAIKRHNVPAAPTVIHQVTKHLTVVVAKSFKTKVMAEHYFDVTFTTRYGISYSWELTGCSSLRTGWVAVRYQKPLSRSFLQGWVVNKWSRAWNQIVRIL